MERAESGQGIGKEIAMRLAFNSPTRGYIVDMNQDLFGMYILRRHRYGLTNRRGGVKHAGIF